MSPQMVSGSGVSTLCGRDVPAPAPPLQLHRLLEQVPAQHRPALVCQGGEVSFSELNARGSRLARALVRLPGLDAAEVVAVRLPPSDRLLVALLAIWKAGAAYLPLDTASPPERVRYVLRDARPALVLTERGDPHLGIFQELSVLSLALEDLEAEASNLPDDPLSDEEALQPSVLHPRDRLALVLYTSGSTGEPKGVRLAHATVLNRLLWQWRELPYGPEEHVCVFKTALTFVDSVAEIWGPLLQGRALLVVGKEVAANTECLVRALCKHQVERLVLVPSLLRAILQYVNMEGTKELSRLRLWVCSGETLTLSLAEQFFDFFPGARLCNLYGSTEVMGDVTYQLLRGPEDAVGLRALGCGSVPIGVPLDNTTVYLLDSELRTVPCGEQGELYVSGSNVAHGYVGGRDPHRFIVIPPHLASHMDHGRLFRTGDLARMQHGFLLFDGRTDSQVKVRGQRVDLSEIEAALARVRGVDKGVVLCHRPHQEDQELVAFVTPREGERVSERQVDEALRLSLPAYGVPHVRLLDAFPLLVNGKVDRQALLRGYSEARMEPDYSGAAPSQAQAARVLLDAVAEVLGASARSRISLDGSFFYLGGNSLNSVATVSLLRERGYCISVKDFIRSESLREVLERLRYKEGIVFNDVLAHSSFFFEKLEQRHKKDVYSLTAHGFLQKGNLEPWLMPKIDTTDIFEYMEQIWNALLEKDFSFVIMDSRDDSVLGYALAFDAADEPKYRITNNLRVIYEWFLPSLTKSIWDEMVPERPGQVLHSTTLAIAVRLDPRDSVLVMHALEQEVVQRARAAGFSAIITTNTSPLTQQLCRDVLGYRTLLDYQVNLYQAPDGSRPFQFAPDERRVLVAWRSLDGCERC